MKVEDEDENNKDDRLGVAYVETGALQAGTKREYKLGLSLRKAGDKWVILTRFLTVGCLQGQWKNWGGFIEVDVKVEEGKETENATRPYTLGPSEMFLSPGETALHVLIG